MVATWASVTSSGECGNQRKTNNVNRPRPPPPVSLLKNAVSTRHKLKKTINRPNEGPLNYDLERSQLLFQKKKNGENASLPPCRLYSKRRTSKTLKCHLLKPSVNKFSKDFPPTPSSGFQGLFWLMQITHFYPVAMTIMATICK